MSCQRCKGLGRFPHYVRSGEVLTLFANISCDRCGGYIEPERPKQEPGRSRVVDLSPEREGFYLRRRMGKHSFKR